MLREREDFIQSPPFYHTIEESETIEPIKHDLKLSEPGHYNNNKPLNSSITNSDRISRSTIEDNSFSS